MREEKRKERGAGELEVGQGKGGEGVARKGRKRGVKGKRGGRKEERERDRIAQLGVNFLLMTKKICN